jgi:hypothetical protein
MRLGTAKRFAILFCLLAFFAASLPAQVPPNSGSLRGQVTDPSGAVVIGAAVSATAPGGESQKTVSDKLGSYVLHGLPAGTVTVDATAPGFTPYQMPNVIIPAGQAQKLDIAFGIAVKQEQVTVQSETPGVDVNPANNASATVLKGADLEALSDDPDQLEQDLLALAGPSVGPNGGQIYIDGFSNGTLPPKSAIREIRINQNPFSAEYDRPGFGRVEVFTKPGSDKWHGQLSFNENNSVFNSRNPYVLSSIPPYHSERYGGNLSGALSKKLSVFVNAERRNINETAAINATTLDASGNPLPFTQAVLAPETRTNISPRFDWQLTPSNTLTARYQFLKNDQENQGIGGLTLAGRAYAEHQTQHTLQVGDTQVLSAHLINETRFQFIRDTSSQIANLPGVAALNVLGEFSGGGSTVGQTLDTINRYELQNYTSWAIGKHFVKFGGRLRVSQDSNQSNANYNGTFTFSGTPAVAGTPAVGDIPATPAIAAVTPLQAYLAGTPSQFSVVQGNPSAELSFADAGLYVEDDWKFRPNLTLSYGVRYESQTSIGDKADFAPRVGLSWGLGSAKSAPKTVLRLGYGIFYDRFTQDLVLQAQRLNGINEQQTIYTASAQNPIQCAPLPTPAAPEPTTASDCTLPPSISAPTIYQISPHLRAPYTMQTAVSLERQLGSVGTVSFTYLNSRGLHQFILENANAPYAPHYDSKLGNIYQYNSEAIFKQNQFITNVQIRLSQKLSLMGFYALGYANSDTGGPSSNPSNSFDLTQDYGRASFDIRNRLFLSGTASLAHNIRISPFVVANSGAPFNITTGSDDNKDSFFNDRPAFAPPGCAAPTKYGCFNSSPTPGERLIPINYGNGPANVTVNMRLSKTFGFGAGTKKPDASSNPSPGERGPGGRGGGPGGPPGGGFGGPRGMGGIFGPSTTSRRFNLTLTMTARNLFNTWNPGTPIGNLSSTNFGRSNSLAGGPFSSGTANRRIDFQAIFSF